MITKFYKNEKFQAVFFPVIYFLLIIAIVVTGCFIFKKKYYQPIVVDGKSMQPTLIGGQTADNGSGSTSLLRYHYGVADLNKSSVNNIRRFDVIVTYYPSSWGTPNSYKIKRVWGFPGETISLNYDESDKFFTFTVSHAYDGFNTTYKSSVITSIEKEFEIEHLENGERDIKKTITTFSVVKWNVPSKSFNINAAGTKRTFQKTLDKDEYFVMGDNWASSTDSYEKRTESEKLTRKYIQGRVLYISAYVSLVNGEPTAFYKFKERYYF